MTGGKGLPREEGLRQEVGSDVEKFVRCLGVKPVPRPLNGVVVHVQEVIFQARPGRRR